MARPQASVIPPQMYRHFAVVTLALTLAVAFFADGENREAAAVQVAERQPPKTVRRPATPKFHGTPPTVGRFSDDDGGVDVPWGAPMRGTIVNAPSNALPSIDALLQAGYPKSYLDTLSPQERQRLLESLQVNRTASPDALRALATASARRSGAPESSD